MKVIIRYTLMITLIILMVISYYLFKLSLFVTLIITLFSLKLLNSILLLKDYLYKKV